MSDWNTPHQRSNWGVAALVFFVAVIMALANAVSAQSFVLPGEKILLVELEDLSPPDTVGIFPGPFHFIAHDGSVDLLDLRNPLPEDLVSFANEGSLDELSDSLGGQGDRTGRIFTVNTGIPTWNGSNRSVRLGDAAIVRPLESQYISVLGRVYPSNDAIIANDDPKRYRLYDDDGNFLGPLVIEIYGSEILDAGTRLNDEQDLVGLDRDFLVPGNLATTARTENLEVRPHPGFNGSSRNPEGEPVRLLSDEASFCFAGDSNCVQYAAEDLDFTTGGSPLVRIRISEDFHGGYTGSFVNRDRAGEGFSFDFISTNPRQIVFYWYTYEPDDSGEQMWLIGQGVVPSVEDPSPRVDLYKTQGGQLTSLSNPDDVELIYWGSGFISYGGNSPGCGVLALGEIRPEDPTLVLDLPTTPEPGYPLERLGPYLTGLEQYCGAFTFSAIAPF